MEVSGEFVDQKSFDMVNLLIKVFFGFFPSSSELLSLMAICEEKKIDYS